MDQTSAFRRLLAQRLLGIALVAGTSALGFATGCSTEVNSGGGGQGGTGASMAPAGFTTTECFASPQAGAGGNGGAGGAAGNGGAGGATCMGIGGGDAGWPAECPCGYEAEKHFSSPLGACGGNVGPAYLQNGECCYDVYRYNCMSGRPFLVEGRARTAGAAMTAATPWSEGAAALPDTSALSAEERRALAEAWARDGLLEHASIASFGRFALELLAVAAPPHLVEMAHRASLDEIRHARLCLGLASAYGDAPLAVSRFPFEGRVEIAVDLADIAARAVREGCVGETLAAVVAAEQLARAVDPAVRAALSVIAEDEARHAELAFRTVAWAIATGGDPVRCAVAAAFASAMEGNPFVADTGPMEDALGDHGRLDASAMREAMARAVADVVRPAAAALLGQGRPS